MLLDGMAMGLHEWPFVPRQSPGNQARMLSDEPVKNLWQGRYLTMQSRRGWEFVHRRHPVVAVIAWTPGDRLLLVEQYREPIAQSTIELPAGLVGDEDDGQGESALSAAARELEEETGWKAGQLTEIIRCPSSAGLSDEEVIFVAAEQLTRTGAGGGTASEAITVHAVSRADIDQWLDQQRTRSCALDPKIYAALYWFDRCQSRTR